MTHFRLIVNRRNGLGEPAQRCLVNSPTVQKKVTVVNPGRAHK
jgi:hypothetical protein